MYDRYHKDLEYLDEQYNQNIKMKVLKILS